MTTNVLAMESSCDETAVSILQQEGAHTRVLAERLYSQIDQHAVHGGVVPEIAARAHLMHFPALITECLEESALAPQHVDAIACTTGPGLVGGLLVGSMIARSMALMHNRPFYGIHHLEGHLLSPRFSNDTPPQFPYLVLLASGGHTLICVAESVGKYRVLGRSRDDALGEAFDKSAIIMGLPYPGGPILEKLANDGVAGRFSLPSPLIGGREKRDRESCDFSFSGLKTAIARQWTGLTPKGQTPNAQADMAFAFHRAVQKILNNRLANAIRIFRAQYPTCHKPSVVFVGGVAANKRLTQSLQDFCLQEDVSLSTVPLALCTDNATMIAWAALERIAAHIAPDPANTTVRPRWSLEQ